MMNRVAIDMEWERSESEKRMEERAMGLRPPLPEPVIFPTAKRRSVQLSALGFTVTGRGAGD